MGIRELMRRGPVYLDGGMGTLLQARGLRPGEAPETWTLTHPEEVTAIHRAYYDAGSNIVMTDTFGVNPLRYDDETMTAMVRAAAACVRRAAETSTGGQEKYVGLDLGPTGKLLKPLGPLDFEDALASFAKVVRLGVEAGVDCIVIETMNDGYETKAALLAAKENSDLPVFVSNAYGSDGKLMTGASPEAMVAMLEGLGADVIGLNCSYGPEALAPVAERYLAAASVPVMLKPNAGLPRDEGGRTVYDVSPERFTEVMADLARKGLRVMGGCCGTTPAFIRMLVERTAGIAIPAETPKKRTVIASGRRALALDREPVMIGERINPTGKKRFRQALAENDMAYILAEGVAQEERGAHVLDVNVGTPGIDEAAVLTRVVRELQAVTDLPLQIDTADPAAMERALRVYAGKAMINSVNGSRDSMAAVFPLAKKYGGVVVALTLDEQGIPPTVEGRAAIAERILKTAAEYGIGPENIVFDPLTMTVSADGQAPSVTLESLKEIRKRTGCGTVLGVSNVSFGLPSRETVGAAFLTLALEAGLSAAIMNPRSDAMLGAYRSWMALKGLDANCAAYIDFASALPKLQAAAPGAPAPAAKEAAGSPLRRAVLKGLRAEAARLTAEALAGGADPMALVNEEIIPALDDVGRGFEAKTVFLPQLMMSAEAAEQAFAGIKQAMGAKEGGTSRGAVVMATVRGDVHDIGKNIVRLLLENYGYAVSDLGKDVAPETVLAEVKRLHAPICGLSALMTTTVPAMAKTVALIHREAPWCRVMVGGAVLTEAYAREIGADGYAKDAMAAVRCAEALMDASSRDAQ